MPYINQHQRDQIAHATTAPRITLDAGSLNYLITKLVIDHIQLHGTSYRTINEAIGVLECAKLELYRRLAAPYEDTKIATNGDVYPQGTDK
jgi:hypothetical protein